MTDPTYIYGADLYSSPFNMLGAFVYSGGITITGQISQLCFDICVGPALAFDARITPALAADICVEPAVQEECL